MGRCRKDHIGLSLSHRRRSRPAVCIALRSLAESYHAIPVWAKIRDRGHHCGPERRSLSHSCKVGCPRKSLGQDRPRGTEQRKALPCPPGGGGFDLHIELFLARHLTRVLRDSVDGMSGQARRRRQQGGSKKRQPTNAIRAVSHVHLPARS